MKELTKRFGYQYTTLMNFRSGMYTIGIANAEVILYAIYIPYESLYHIAKYMLDGTWGFGNMGIDK